MTIDVGQHLPEGRLYRLGEDGPQALSTADVFGGRTVLLFAVPGAFTPTCSNRHLPGFVEKADEIKARGVDAIACLSVNDAYVMAAWGRDQKVEGKIEMLADGSAEFTRALGLDADLSANGMGVRSRRYAMLVRDGIVERLMMEPGRGLSVSSAESFLETP